MQPPTLRDIYAARERVYRVVNPTPLMRHPLLSADTGLAFVFVLHMGRHQKSVLTEILARATSMPVQEVARAVAPRPNHVYVIAPGTELALRDDEQRGYDLFRDYGCISCHQGINVGGNMLQKFGVMRDYFAGRSDLTPADQGLFAKTGWEEDRYVFRVPSLRNVALTAPYFHDGSRATLEDAVTAMANYQLGRELNAEQAGQIAAFLRTLTGELQGRPL